MGPSSQDRVLWRASNSPAIDNYWKQKEGHGERAERGEASERDTESEKEEREQASGERRVRVFTNVVACCSLRRNGSMRCARNTPNPSFESCRYTR